MEKKYCCWNSPWRTSQVNHSSLSSNKNKLYLRYSISIKTLKISDLTVFGFNVKKCRMVIRTVTNIPGFLLGYLVSFSFFTDKNLQTENNFKFQLIFCLIIYSRNTCRMSTDDARGYRLWILWLDFISFGNEVYLDRRPASKSKKSLCSDWWATARRRWWVEHEIRVVRCFLYFSRDY